MSGHYTTFIKPLYDGNGRLACVCGADMKFEWLAKELQWVDKSSKTNKVLNRYRALTEFSFYTVVLDNNGNSIEPRLHLWTDFPRRELKHSSPLGRVLDV